MLKDQDSTLQTQYKTILPPTPEVQDKLISKKTCDDKISGVHQPEQSSCNINMKFQNFETYQIPVFKMQNKITCEKQCDDTISEAKQLQMESNSTLTLRDENLRNCLIDGSLNNYITGRSSIYNKEQDGGHELTDQSNEVVINTGIMPHEGEHIKQNDSQSSSMISGKLGQACEAEENGFADLEIINQNPTGSSAVSKSSNVKYGNEPIHIKGKHGDGNAKAADAKPLTKHKYVDIYCKDCDHTFKFRVTYEKHLREDRCTHQCDICGKVFKYVGGKGHSLYVDHMSFHYKQKDHECTICGKRFILKSHMRQHLKRHAEPKPICDQCGDSFPTITAVKHHKNNVHNANKEQFTCPECPKIFKSKSGVNNHFKHNHDTEYKKTFPCSICGKQFKEPYVLKRHGAVHKETKDFKCDHCSSSFKLLIQLKQHKRRHFQAYSCFCKICNKGFYGPHKLRAHEMAHAGLKPHQCSVCEYRCTIKENLRKHEKIHKK